MPLVVDPRGRTWDGKQIGWIRVINNARYAEYSWKRVDGRRKLVYDKKHGMYDYKGRHIKDPAYETRPVLINPETKMGWEHFPNTEDAQEYAYSLRFHQKISAAPITEEEATGVTIIK